MPKELMGLEHESENGEPICYGYNLPGGYVGAKCGENCPKGLHVCMKRGCKMRHSYVGNHRGQASGRTECPHDFGTSGAPLPQPSLNASDETECGALNTDRGLLGDDVAAIEK